MRAVALFCPGTEVLPDHVLFQPELHAQEAPLAPPAEVKARVPASATAGGGVIDPVANLAPVSPAPSDDPRLATAVAKHVLAVYEQAGRNQRRTAKLLAISRAKLARHLQALGEPASG